MAVNLMTHLVAYYPDRKSSLEAALGLVEGGASYLEVQFPFSDPSADGPSIQEACTRGIEAGFTVDGGLSLVREICTAVDTPVFIMSYASIVTSRGIIRFLDDVKRAGAAGVIVPDLVPGMDEGLYRHARGRGLQAIPVITPFLKTGRLEEILSVETDYVYVAIRRGITGKTSVIDESVTGFLDGLASTGVKVLAGFGVRSGEQATRLSSHVHAVIVGSYLVDVIRKAAGDGPEGIRQAVRRGVQSLTE